MSFIIPVGSGKGGVGKTIFTANLGILLANSGKKTILLDLDLGGSNLHTCLGIKNRHSGISSVINKKENSIDELVCETGIDNLYFIPGDTLNPGTGNLPFYIKQKIIKQVYRLDADFILLDLGAGSTYNTIDFFLVSSYGIIFTSPETTSVLNAYSFIKTAVFRMLYRSFRAKSAERDIILNFVNRKLEGSGRSFAKDLINELTAHSYNSGRTASEKIEEFHPWLIINRVENSDSINLGLKLQDISRKNIGIDIELLGSLSEDKEVQLSIFKRTPAVLSSPGSPFTRDLGLITSRLASGEVFPQPELYLDDDESLKIDDD